MNDVQLWWVGIECRQRQEQVDDIFGTVDLVTSDGQHHEAHKFPDDADYQSLGPDGQRIVNARTLLYSGPAKDLVLAASLAEWDSGDIQAYKDAAAQAVAGVATAALAAATGAGALAKPLVDFLAEALVGFATDLLGTDADKYAPRVIALTPADMVYAGQRRTTLRRGDDPKTIRWTDVIVLTSEDDGGDPGEYALYFDVRGPGWGDPYEPMPAGSALDGSVAAVSRHHDHMDLFWAAPDGSVWARSWNGQEWSAPYQLVPAANARAVAAASRFDEHLDLFWTTVDGAIKARSWLGGPGWGDPYELMPAGSAQAGSVAAASRYRDHMDLFWIAPDGSIWARSWNGQEWSAPYPLVPAANARAVTAASRFDEHLDLFWTTADAAMNARSWLSGPGWGDPYELAPAWSAMVGASASRYRDHMDLFWAAPDGSVWARSWNGQEWGAQYPLATPANARAVAAASRFEEHVDLFWTTADGAVVARSWME